MNEYQNVNKEYKALQRITWSMLWSQPAQTVSRLNNHVTVHYYFRHIRTIVAFFLLILSMTLTTADFV